MKKKVIHFLKKVIDFLKGDWKKKKTWLNFFFFKKKNVIGSKNAIDSKRKRE